MGFFNGIGSALTGSILGIGQSLGQNAMNKAMQKRAYEQQRKLMGLQYAQQMGLNVQGQELGMKTWRETNYPAQMSMLKEAGLNAGLLYGMGGAGGSTTSTPGGGSASGGNAPSMPFMELNALQGAQAMAQIQLAKAQAEKTKAEATKIKGVDTTEVETRISKLIAETTNERTKNRLIEIEADIAEIEKSYRPYQLMSNIENTIENTNQLKLSNSITKDTYDSIVTEVRERAIGQTIINELNRANIDQTKAETNAITERLLQTWADLRIKGEQLDLNKRQVLINQFSEEIKAEYPSLWNVGGSIAKKAIDTLENLEELLLGTKPPSDKVNK